MMGVVLSRLQRTRTHEKHAARGVTVRSLLLALLQRLRRGQLTPVLQDGCSSKVCRGYEVYGLHLSCYGQRQC
jgi:hypothetical protein